MAQPRKMPANAPEPQDHKEKKSAAARKAEADGFVTVEQCGVKLKIPIGGNVPLAAAVKFSEGDEFGGTRLMLGDKQWEAFLAKNPTVDDYNAIGEQMKEAVGN